MAGRSRRVVAGLFTLGVLAACTPDTLPDGRNVYDEGCRFQGGVPTWVAPNTYQCGGLIRRPNDAEYWAGVAYLRANGWPDNDHVYEAANTRATWVK